MSRLSMARVPNSLDCGGCWGGTSFATPRPHDERVHRTNENGCGPVRSGYGRCHCRIERLFGRRSRVVRPIIGRQERWPRCPVWREAGRGDQRGRNGRGYWRSRRRLGCRRRWGDRHRGCARKMPGWRRLTRGGRAGGHHRSERGKRHLLPCPVHLYRRALRQRHPRHLHRVVRSLRIVPGVHLLRAMRRQ